VAAAERVSEVAERFAENLAYYFKQSGLSQDALAARAEIHRTQVGDLLRSKQAPRLETIVRLAGALGTSPASLIEGIEL
jgi:transcriptional regulator with XRE-family HTH domain